MHHNPTGFWLPSFCSFTSNKTCSSSSSSSLEEDESSSSSSSSSSTSWSSSSSASSSPPCASALPGAPPPPTCLPSSAICSSFSACSRPRSWSSLSSCTMSMPSPSPSTSMAEEGFSYTTSTAKGGTAHVSRTSPSLSATAPPLASIHSSAWSSKMPAVVFSSISSFSRDAKSLRT